jgi:amino acid adenylation domain-containing protein
MRLHDDLERRRAELSPTKLAMLERLRRGRTQRADDTIARRPNNTPVPLSSAQERLWFLDQLTPGSATYNMGGGARLRGRLDIDALKQTVADIVQRHEALRTTFRAVDGRPEQLIAPLVTVDLPADDLTTLPVDEREAAAARLVDEELRRPFDLARGPLLRVRLLKLDDDHHVLALTMHHIVSDGWSMGVLFHELATLYAARVTGRLGPLPELPLQYPDYAIWQRERLQGESLDRLVSYWKTQLGGAPAVLDLPTDRPRPAVQSYRGAVQEVPLPSGLLERVSAFSAHEGVTPFMTLLAAFQTLLLRYTGQEDLVVGTPVAGRPRSETEELIGLFVNTLAVRIDLAGDPTFRDLLRRVRETTLDAFGCADLPFDKLVEAVQPTRNLSHTPIFQVMFILQNTPQPPFELPGLSLELLDVDSGTAQVDLTLEVAEGRASLIYNTDLFDAATVVRLGGHYRVLLESIVADPEQRLSDLPLLDATEQAQLRGWNRTAAPYDLESALHALIEQQVERSPDAPALVFEGQQLSYRELNGRANQLAHHLRALGVGPETRVGICVERSPELVVGLLGILKAGGAYVPIDPGYPRDRVAYMLADSGTPVLLTQERLVADLPPHNARTVLLDADWPQIAAEPDSNPEILTRPHNLAYVIYTSGSTGRPKGAMNTHQAIVNRLVWMQEAYGLGPDDRVLQKTPFSFDVSVWEFFWPLLQGACLVMARPGGHQDAAYLRDLIVRAEITTLHFVPSMLQIFLSEREIERCDSLRRVICSGEALTFELQERFFARLGATGAELHNLYGPTEAAVDVTFWACSPNAERRIVPIGRPIANTQMHAIDRSMRPVPIGVPGELYIGGVNLARGYLERPDLTAEKFVPDPFSAEPGARLYRTGDLARFLPDGAIEYLGRLDHQIKLRGLRIELGEIEAALTGHRSVEECVVVAREDAPGDVRLVAYLVGGSGAAPVVAELRNHLKERLPEYMVPSAFVILEELPLSPNGKLDRKALPAPSADRPEIGATFAAPTSELERTIAAIWREVLGVDQVGVQDNFFDLGGHSLLVVRAQSRLSAALGRDLSIVELFQHTTIAALAQHLSQSALRPTPLQQVRDRATLQREALQRQQALAAARRAR